MNKVCFLSAVALLAGSTTLQAQHQPPLQQRPTWCFNSRYEKSLETLSGFTAQAEAAGKTTGPSQRLTGYSRYLNNGSGLQPSDSNWYRYSGSRTSQYDFLYLYYKTSYSYNTIRPDNLADYDTSFYQSLQSPSVPDVIYKQRNGAGKVTRYSENGFKLSDYTYDAQGVPSLLVVKYYDNVAMAWVNNMRIGYQHDAQGRLVSDTVSYWSSATNQWEPDEAREYTVNAVSPPTEIRIRTWNGAAFEPSSRLQISYTAANQFSTIRNEDWYGNGYITQNRDSFAYVGGAIVYHVGQSNINGLTTVMEELRHLNAANLPDSITMRFLNDPVTATFDTSYIRLTWNSFGNPVTQSMREAGESVPDQLLRYYYTNLETGQGVASAPGRNGLCIYPNPADRELQIRPDFSGRYSLSVTNSAGQLVLSSTGNAVSGQSIDLPSGNLNPGQYWLLLRSSAGEEYSARFLRR